MNEIPEDEYATDQTAYEIITGTIFSSNEEQFEAKLKNKF
jgi:hypothetical protein